MGRNNEIHTIRKGVPSGMEAEHRRRSGDLARAANDGNSSTASAAVLGSTTDCLTPPKVSLSSHYPPLFGYSSMARLVLVPLFAKESD